MMGTTEAPLHVAAHQRERAADPRRSVTRPLRDRSKWRCRRAGRFPTSGRPGYKHAVRKTDSRAWSGWRCPWCWRGDAGGRCRRSIRLPHACAPWTRIRRVRRLPNLPATTEMTRTREDHYRRPAFPAHVPMSPATRWIAVSGWLVCAFLLERIVTLGRITDASQVPRNPPLVLVVGVVLAVIALGRAIGTTLAAVRWARVS